MKKILFFCSMIGLPVLGLCQSDPHYTMFMYNKLMYNPAYAGNKDMASINATYRDQWVGIDGAPKTIAASIDAPIGSYMNPFRKVALGLSFSRETIGVETNTDIMTYYAYRIPVGSSVLSFGLSAGAKLYSAAYSQLNLYNPQSVDPNLQHDIKSAFLPNFGAGVFWSSEKFYAGFSVPNLLENYYDNLKINNIQSREIRAYYLSGGYVIQAGESFKLVPQVMLRYAGNATYHLPMNTDFNLSGIIYNRLMIGATYRTDNSVEGILHLQVNKYISVGYAYDYTLSQLKGLNSGTHEVVLGFDFVRDNNNYATPRFVKSY